MEKGFRTILCPGCSIKLKFSISEKDYGITKTIRCPKCKAEGRVQIPRPALEIRTTTKPQSPFPDFDPFSSVMDELLKGKKP